MYKVIIQLVNGKEITTIFENEEDAKDLFKGLELSLKKAVQFYHLNKDDLFNLPLTDGDIAVVTLLEEKENENHV